LGSHKAARNHSWDDVTGDYLAWLSRKTSKSYRLLTEAEWEYAARAGSQTIYSWGDEIGKNHANCEGCGSQWDSKQTAPVGSFQPNAFGLHDTQGNVWEWVADCYTGDYANSPIDGNAPPDVAGCLRVLRGGSWNMFPGHLGLRIRYAPGIRSSIFGFRVARTPEP
jgi:formylglycine-generating enzyme required for sulfatase activity